MNPIHVLRRLARALRHSPDRLAHPLRRQRAAMGIADLGRPDNVLFVCYGNICRSPYAEMSFRRAVPSIRAVSAGFVGPDRPTPTNGLSAARRRGLDLGDHRSRLLTGAMIGEIDLIVVMSESQRRELKTDFGRADGVVLLGDFDPDAIDTRTVLDPYDRDEEVFDAVYDRIDRCIAGLAAAIQAARDD